MILYARSSLAVPSSVNVVGLSRDVLRVITQQPGDQIANLERCPSPLDLALPIHLTATCRPRLVLHGTVNNARADAVDADLPIADLLRGSPAQTNDGMLGGGVGCIFGEA